jgi:hypothetical protein
VPKPDGLEELSTYLLTSTYNTLLAYPGSKNVAESLTLKNDTASVVKQKLYYRTDNKKLINWTKSKNASNLKFSLARATGIYKGSFELWAGDDAAGSETKQKLMTTCAHKGVLLLARDPDVVRLPELENLAPGFYTAPLSVKDNFTGTKKTVTVSYPFIVRPVKVNHGAQAEELPRDPSAN